MAISTFAQNQPKKKFFKNKYRWYSVAVILALLPFLAADTNDFPAAVFSSGAEYISNNLIAREPRQKDYDAQVAIRNVPQEIPSPNPNTLPNAALDSQIQQQLIDAGYNLGQGNASPNNPPASSSSVAQQPEGPLPLEKVVPKPTSPQFRSEIVFARLKIRAPIQYSKLDDIFEKNPDGSVNFIKQIEENSKDTSHLSTPVQRLLTKGVVHMAFSPLPGQVGNSYVVGHSSNYQNVRSDYNYVFKELDKAKNDDVFIVYDQDGRELRFKVFESVPIDAKDSTTAYKSFDNRRVVTLQASILENVNGRLEPTKRRLVRGELQI